MARLPGFRGSSQLLLRNFQQEELDGVNPFLSISGLTQYVPQLSPSCVCGFADRQVTHTHLVISWGLIYARAATTLRARVSLVARSWGRRTRVTSTRHIPPNDCPDSRDEVTTAAKLVPELGACLVDRQHTHTPLGRRSVRKRTTVLPPVNTGNNPAQGMMENNIYGRRRFELSGPNIPSCPVTLGRRNGLPVGKRVN